MKYLLYIFLLNNLLFAENKFTMETVKINGNLMVDLNNNPINGILERISKYPQEGTIVVNNYKNGLLNGISKSYYSNKKIMMISNYENGLSEGESIYYDNLGNIRTIGTYKNDKKNGLTKIYNDNETYYIYYVNNSPISGYFIDNKNGRKTILNENELKKNF